MLGRFLGKDQKPAPPKNQIEVVCPVCGAAQYEPRLVVTTFCKKCGEHLRIAGRKVIASSQINPVPSTVYPSDISSTGRIFEQEMPAPPLAASAPTASTGSQPEDTPLGLGHLMGLVQTPGQPTTPPAPAGSDSSSPEPHAHPVAAAPVPAVPATATGSTLQRMKDGALRQQYFKDVDCFECHHKFKVGRSAKSTGCPACGKLICLEDFDINLPSTQSILTRGDILIRKHGNISAEDIKCRDLKLFGQVSGQIECTGDFVLRTSGNIFGEVRCHRLIVEKGSDVRFHNLIYADEVDVQARVTGNIQCRGRVVIGSHGVIQGDVTARAVSIDPGGELDGAMNILRTTPPVPATPQVTLPLAPPPPSVEDDPSFPR